MYNLRIFVLLVSHDYLQVKAEYFSCGHPSCLHVLGGEVRHFRFVPYTVMNDRIYRFLFLTNNSQVPTGNYSMSAASRPSNSSSILCYN